MLTFFSHSSLTLLPLFSHSPPLTSRSQSRPLILYVHGSGPRNSSLQWNWLVNDVARKSEYFHVAIDCPGYGRSPGDKQTIRSYPGQFISSVVRSLGKTSALALVGSSQGACAVINAVLEVPSICQNVAVCHPVGHAVSRYAKITQPALLLFDSDDDGHPISVGRRMRRFLPNPIWFEFASGKDGDWLAENMPKELLEMLQSGPRPRRQSAKLPVLTRLCGGIRAWQKAHGREFEEYEVQEDEVLGMVEGQGDQGEDYDYDQDHGHDHDHDLDVEKQKPWTTIVDSVLGVVKYVSPNGEVYDKRPAGVLVMSGKRGDGRQDGIVLFEDDEEQLEKQKKAAKAAEAEAREKELLQRTCSLCEQPLLADPVPARIHSCRHVFCACCVEETLQFAARKCPVSCCLPRPLLCRRFDGVRVGRCAATRKLTHIRLLLAQDRSAGRTRERR